MIERKILIGMLTNTAYLQQVSKIWNPRLVESTTARMLMGWAMEYFAEYKQACGAHIEDIFYVKLAAGLDLSMASDIEENILPELSDEYESGGAINVDFLIKETIKSFNTVKFKSLGNEIEATLSNKNVAAGDRVEAIEKLRANTTPVRIIKDASLDASRPEMQEAVRRAFSDQATPLFKFPGSLGEFWGSQFVAGGFIALLAPEKRGKTWQLLEIAMLAARQGIRVAFFQAGDMSDPEQLRRMTSYIARRPYKEHHETESYIAVKDCKLNQLNICTRDERLCDFGCWDGFAEDFEFKSTTRDQLVEAYEINRGYIPCYGCAEWKKKDIGAIWLQKRTLDEVLEAEEAVRIFTRFFKKYKGTVRLSSHANGTLSVRKMKEIQDDWEEEGFIPELILLDYADLCVPSQQAEFRHQQNQIWKELRGMTQTSRAGVFPLIVTPTQADSQAYTVDTLRLSNFSEDKRKFAHVTAFYGLNQDTKGREKSLGVLRINELLIREGAGAGDRQVTILQDLDNGRPRTASMFCADYR